MDKKLSTREQLIAEIKRRISRRESISRDVAKQFEATRSQRSWSQLQYRER